MPDSIDIPMVSIVGTSNSGKTTLLEKLVAALSARGYQVAVIKHARHFSVDQPGKDSWRYREAGASTVVLASVQEMALMRRWEVEWTPQKIGRMIPDADLIITEGYKWADLPKIEVYRQGNGEAPLFEPHQLLAMVGDREGQQGIPWFDLEDVIGLADFLIGKFLERGRGSLGEQ